MEKKGLVKSGPFGIALEKKPKPKIKKTILEIFYLKYT